MHGLRLRICHMAYVLAHRGVQAPLSSPRWCATNSVWRPDCRPACPSRRSDRDECSNCSLGTDRSRYLMRRSRVDRHPVHPLLLRSRIRRGSRSDCPRTNAGSVISPRGDWKCHTSLHVRTPHVPFPVPPTHSGNRAHGRHYRQQTAQVRTRLLPDHDVVGVVRVRDVDKEACHLLELIGDTGQVALELLGAWSLVHRPVAL